MRRHAHQASWYLRELSRLHESAGCWTAAEFFARTVWHGTDVLRTGTLAAVDRSMARQHYTWRVQGERIVLPSGSFGGAREMYARRPYFAVPGFEIRRSDTVVDLGANVGLFTTLAALKARRVVAVEAQSRFLDEIQRNLDTNRGRAEVALELGLIGTGEGLFANPERLKAASHFEIQPPVLSMPSLIQRHALERIDFLKCDIEGSEFDLFRDGRGWLDKIIRIAAEVHSEFGRPESLATHLRTEGFTVRLLDSHLQPAPPSIRDRSSYLYAWRPETA